MKKTSKILRFGLIGVVAVLGACGLGAGAAWSWWSQAIAPTAQSSEAVLLRVPPGASAYSIGTQLQDQGLIRSELAWKLWVRWLGMQEPNGSFQTGTYELTSQATLPELANTIWTGQVKEDSFTIPEGWTLKDMATYFDQLGWFSGREFLAAVDAAPRDRFSWLPDVELYEGFLYPDTYQIPVDQQTPELVVDVMLQRFETLALPIFEQRQQTDLSLLDWVTLSSIVEREAVVPEERTLIAGVFWNRLREGMTLGSDPTVEYGLGVTQTPDQPLTLAQVRTPSPYNTYINPGLPPTPIGSPGLASLQATLQPEQTDYLYFVALYDGTHVFSKTLTEHVRAQYKIRDRQDAKRNQADSVETTQR